MEKTETYEIELVDITRVRMKKQASTETKAKIMKTIFSLKAGEGFTVPKTDMGRTELVKFIKAYIDNKEIKTQPVKKTGVRIIKVK